jgi:hypothetical protein
MVDQQYYLTQDTNKKEGTPAASLSDASQQEKKKHELFNYFLYYENKSKLF